MAVSPALQWSAEEHELAALIARVAIGDEAALSKLYDAASSVVYGLALRVLRDPSAAEEITMEVFLQVWRTAASYDSSRGSGLAWLVTMTRSRAIDYLRSRIARRGSAELPIDEVFDLRDPRPTPERESIDAGRVRVIRDAMTQLPKEQLELINMAYYSGLTHTEIAGQTGLPLGTVKTRIRSGMTRLRELLDPYAGGL